MCILGLERTFKKFTNFLNPSFVFGIRTSNFPNNPLKKVEPQTSFLAHFRPTMHQKCKKRSIKSRLFLYLF